MSSIDMERFRNDINRYRNKTGMPWAALSEKAGVSPAMFTRIKKGSAVTLEAFAQLCSSFQLNPIDYMPELQTKPTKEQPMEDVKRLSIDGKDFTIEDVELRSGPAWTNGPRRADAELPDGQVLGSIMASDGEWLWRLAGEKWNHTEPAEGPIAEYIGHEPNRFSAIRSLLQAIEDRYSTTAADDPWASMPDDPSTTMSDAVSQTQTAQVGDPWASAFPDAAALPDPDPGIDQGAMPATGPGIGM